MEKNRKKTAFIRWENLSPTRANTKSVKTWSAWQMVDRMRMRGTGPLFVAMSDTFRWILLGKKAGIKGDPLGMGYL
ncbi:MAG: hypothetical protein CM15mP54_09650 [Paracoccaceae bacterium]|nr:MAG: hypothetical protein CM15mP54_09650 [Paracoccaceae bacterium]